MLKINISLAITIVKGIVEKYTYTIKKIIYEIQLQYTITIIIIINSKND